MGYRAEETIATFCEKCQREHEGTWVEFCNKCGIEHAHRSWKTVMRDGESLHICGDNYKTQVTMEKKIANMSPEEVMSGAHYGMDMIEGMKGRSSNNYSEEVAPAKKELAQALAEV